MLPPSQPDKNMCEHSAPRMLIIALLVSEKLQTSVPKLGMWDNQIRKCGKNNIVVTYLKCEGMFKRSRRMKGEQLVSPMCGVSCFSEKETPERANKDALGSRGIREISGLSTVSTYYTISTHYTVSTCILRESRVCHPKMRHCGKWISLG